ncbi:uncharacterized protein FIBRA_09458 [Fibroporia radiculosa]|uniref:Uncharacterized protein n=1 Tax=Fibroporia radiculosa TaxID=599839 RepID=J7S6H9_9APHY|nr:uncharacterized protein FIBRA_09458 [Fibroporia radiculosa]CCM07124.1 predicted protein [Fibroporia radiculosa]
MSDNNSRAVNKPHQFEGDKGKSKEFLDELYLKRDKTIPNATPILAPIRSKDNWHSVVPPLAEKSSPTPSYLTPTAVSSSRSVVAPTPHTSPLQSPTKLLPSKSISTSLTIRPSFFSGIFDSPEPVNPSIPVEEQPPTPAQTEPKPEPPRSPVDLNPEEEPANRHPNNPEDSDPEPSDEEEGDMSNNNSGAVNKPNQFEGDKGKSKEFLDELYCTLLEIPKRSRLTKIRFNVLFHISKDLPNFSSTPSSLMRKNPYLILTMHPPKDYLVGLTSGSPSSRPLE